MFREWPLHRTPSRRPIIEPASAFYAALPAGSKTDKGAATEATAKHARMGGISKRLVQDSEAGGLENFAEVRNSWRNSDVVGRFVVFDISHNKCRLIATIKYRWRMVYIRRILSHAEYDEKEWQKS